MHHVSLLGLRDAFIYKKNIFVHNDIRVRRLVKTNNVEYLNNIRFADRAEPKDLTQIACYIDRMSIKVVFEFFGQLRRYCVR